MPPTPRACGHCGAVVDSPKRCSRCRGVWYCRAECQRTAWPTHRRSCVPRKAKAASSDSSTRTASAATTKSGGDEGASLGNAGSPLCVDRGADDGKGAAGGPVLYTPTGYRILRSAAAASSSSPRDSALIVHPLFPQGAAPFRASLRSPPLEPIRDDRRGPVLLPHRAAAAAARGRWLRFHRSQRVARRAGVVAVPRGAPPSLAGAGGGRGGGEDEEGWYERWSSGAVSARCLRQPLDTLGCMS